MSRSKFLFAQLVTAMLVTAPACAADLAYITAQSPLNALLVYDVATMTELARVTGFGIEPSRMVANPDRSRLYVVSRTLAAAGQPAEMRVHMVSTSQRRILRTVVVGLSTGRAIGISPDGHRVYVWKQTASPQAISVAVLDARTLAEIDTVPLPWTQCGTIHQDIAVSPDGRVVTSICTDGLRVIDPVTLVPTTLPLATGLAFDLIGFSPNGQEVYLRHSTNASSFEPKLAAIHLDTGVRSEVAFDLPEGSPSFGGAAAARMVRVQRPADPPGSPTVFVTYPAVTGGAPPIASTPLDTLSPPNRHLTRLTSLGAPAAHIIGASEDGRVGIIGNQRFLRRISFDPTASGAVIAVDGDLIEIAPSGTSPLGRSDIVFARPLLEDGFE